MSDIHAGDHVMCLDAKPDKLDPKAHLLCEGRVYRVGAIGCRQDGQLALAFHAIRSDRANWGWAYCIRRFRKLNDEPDSQELIAKIRACKPMRAKEPVA